MTGHPFFDSALLRGCGLGVFRAVILDFRPRLPNRCRVEWFRLQWSLLQGRFACLQQPECRQVRQRRQRRVLMRPEAAFPYVSVAEGAQHPLIVRRAERYPATQ